MSEGVTNISTAVMSDSPEVLPSTVADVSLPPPAPASVRLSGLRPPSKIGRLCAGGAPKPAIPPSPKNNGSSAPMMTRRFSDDYTRKHLADVQEADEEFEGGILFAMGDSKYPPRERKPSTCSTYSVTSMDALWENHPRRLSEAGLRRTSDHSVVLTEDTDSFIIGDRVWVGGNKPGQIAYIGETQFAPGEWAGVVLDEPIGKNDGSVAGVRYFQCESRRGVFSRLTRLTHEPLASASPASPCNELAGSINGGSRPPSALRTSASPGPKTPSSPGPKTPNSPGSRVTPTRTKRSTSPCGSMRSMGSRMSTSTIAAELRIGDRVIVSSSQGSKAGILRYMGPTEFAQGQWCGVELDDPIGKNDGSVEGKRYFECGPRFGLFAPYSKVSRSPSNRRPTSCAVHGSRVNSPPESTASMASSIIGSVTRPRLGVTSLRLSGPRVTSTPMSAKNTLQELLREKQQHIEKLIKEHEVERGELAKITLQTDRVQTALIASQKENSQLLKEIEKMKAEYKALSGQLEDEKQKVEDLMFRAEEDNIHKEDFSRFKEDLLKEKDKLSTNVVSLESELESCKRQIDELQAQCVLTQAQHKAENEILLVQHKDEVQAAHALAAELQKLLDEAHILLREKDGDKESLSKVHIDEVNKIKMESDKALNEIKSKLSEIQLESSEEIKLLEENLAESTNKNYLLNENIDKITIEHNNIISELRSQIDQKQKALDAKTQENIQVTASSKECELELKKELEKLKMNLSAKILDCETLNENNKELNDAMKKVQIEYETLKSNLNSKGLEFEELTNNTTKHNENLRKELEKLRVLVNEKQSEIDTMKAQSDELQKVYEQEKETHKENTSLHIKEISTLQKEIDVIKQDSSIKCNQLVNDNIKNTEEKDNCIKSLDMKVQEISKALEVEKETNHKLEMENNLSNEEVKKLNHVLSDKQQELNVLSSNLAELNTKLSAMELESGDLNRKLRSEIEKSAEIQQHKDKLENELSSLSSRSTSSDEQVNVLTNKLKDAEKELQSLKETNRAKINELERKEQELVQQLENMKAQNNKVNSELAQAASTLEETKQGFEDKIGQLDEKLHEVQEKSSTTIIELENKHQHTVAELIKEMESKNVEKEHLKQQYDQLSHDTSSTINDLNHRLETLQQSGESSESQLKEKLNELITIQNELNQKLEISQGNGNRLQEVNQTLQEELKNTKDGFEIILKNAEEKSNLLQEEINRLQREYDAAKKSIVEQDNLLKESQQKLAVCELEIKSNLDIIAEKDRQISVNNHELKKVLDDKYEVEKKLSENITITESFQQEIRNLTDENSAKNLKMKEQEELVIKYEKQLQSITSNTKHLESEVQQTSENINNLKAQNETFGKQVISLEKTITELNVDVMNRQEKIVTLENDLVNFKAIDVTLQKLKAESESYLKDIENKNLVIAQLNENISSLKKDLVKDVSEKEQRVRLLENEIAELKTIHLHEVGEMKKSIHNIQNEKQEMMKKLTELEEANTKIVELKEQVEKSNEDIQKWTTLNEAQKKNYEQLNTQLQEEYENLKNESKKDRKQLKERLKGSEATCSDYSKQLDQEKTQNKDLQTRLDESNNVIKELQNKIQYLEVSSEKKAGEEKSELQKLLLELQSCHKAHDQESKQLKSEIWVLNEQIAKKTSDSTKYSNHITLLENDIKRYKSQNECLVQEIAQLTNEIKECQKSISKPDLNSNNNNNQKTPIMDTDAKRLLEEKEEVVGQVNFLNSVIVDMQRKNEELKARVEVLEMGCTPQEADEYNFNGIKTRQVAPRMYCDICDVFDAHDTEDCPRQTTDVDAPAPSSDKKKAPPAPRPYCEICEVFGHATEDCDEEETY